MAKADRLERLDLRRDELESAYLAVLVAALRKTAGGEWGLFDHKGDRQARAKLAPVITELTELGMAIGDIRRQLGMPVFDLHEEFVASRGPVLSHAVGEPKQAQAWLDRLGVAATQSGRPV